MPVLCRMLSACNHLPDFLHRCHLDSKRVPAMRGIAACCRTGTAVQPCALQLARCSQSVESHTHCTNAALLRMHRQAHPMTSCIARARATTAARWLSCLKALHAAASVHEAVACPCVWCGRAPASQTAQALAHTASNMSSNSDVMLANANTCLQYAVRATQTHPQRGRDFVHRKSVDCH